MKAYPRKYLSEWLTQIPIATNKFENRNALLAEYEGEEKWNKKEVLFYNIKVADSTYRQQGHGTNQLFDTAQHSTALHCTQGKAQFATIKQLINPHQNLVHLGLH